MLDFQDLWDIFVHAWMQFCEKIEKWWTCAKVYCTMFPSDEELATLRTFPCIESRTLEFKQTTEVPFTKLLPTICAFLNVGGGRIVFGVKDDLSIVGIKTTDKRFDTFLLLIDTILHTSLITTIEGKALHPDSLLVQCVPCWNGCCLVVLTIESEMGKTYQLKDGSRYHRLNASNFFVSGSTLYTETDVSHRVESTKQYIHEQYRILMKQLEKQVRSTQTKLAELQRENEETLSLLHSKIIQEKEDVLVKKFGFLHYMTCGFV